MKLSSYDIVCDVGKMLIVTLYKPVSVFLFLRIIRVKTRILIEDV